MHNFSQIAIKLLNDYRSLIRRQFSPEESVQRLAELGLDKRLPSHEVILYRLVMRVVQAASEKHLNSQASLKYSGVEQFLQHVKATLSIYRLEGNKVIHATQAAARAMISAIQLISLNAERRTPQIAAQLDAAASEIAKYGMEEQKTALLNSLGVRLQEDVDFFLPILNSYKNYLLDNAYPNEEELKEELITSVA